MGSNSNSNSESVMLNEDSRREEKPEEAALALPEQKHEEDSDKNKRKKKKRKKTEPNDRPPPQVCPKPLVVAAPVPEEPKPNQPTLVASPILESKPNEPTLVVPPILEPKPNEATLPDPNNTPKKRKWKRKKKAVLNPEGPQPQPEPKESGNAENPQTQLCLVEHTELNEKKEEKGEEPNVGIVQHPGVCPKPPLGMAVATDLEKKKEAEPSEAPAEQSQSQPQPCSEPGPGGPPTKIGKSKRKRMNRRTRMGELVENQTNLLHLQNALNDAQNQTQPDPPIPICPKPVSLLDQTSPVKPALSKCPEPAPPVGQTIPADSAIPIDAEQKTSKNQGRKLKRELLDGTQPNEHNIEQHVTTVQTSICHTVTPPIGPIMDSHPAIPECPIPVSLIDQTNLVESAPSECPEPEPPIGQTIPADSALPIDTEQKMSKSQRRKLKRKLLDGTQPNEPYFEQHGTAVQTPICHTATLPVGPIMDPRPAILVCSKPVSEIDQTSPEDPAPSECPEPAPPIGKTIPADSTIPVDTEQKMSKDQTRNLLDGTQPNEHNIEQHGTTVQTSICDTVTPPIGAITDPHPATPVCPTAVSLIDQISPVDPAPPIGQTIPEDSAIPIDTEQKMSKNQRRKLRRKLLGGTQPNEHNIKQHGTAVQTSICHTATPPIGPIMDPHPAILVCPKPVSQIDQTSPVDPALSMCPESAPPVSKTIPVEPAIPIDTEHNLSKKQRKRMNRSLRDGAQPNEHNIEQPETPVQTSICHTAAPPIDPTIPMDPLLAIPISPSIPADPDHNTSGKKRKRKRKGALKSEGGKPNEHNGKPTEAAVQKSISSIAATPIVPEQKMTGKKKKRKMISALKSKGSKSVGHNADSTAEALLQGTKGVTVTRAPTGRHSQSSQRCWACRRTDHKINECQKLKSLSNLEEVCFFCGEIGHSLGRCSLSLAGRGRFAKCLLCHAQGHFSYDCPGDGHGNYTKVVADNWPLNKTAAKA